MNRADNERYIIFFVSLACIGLTVESILVKWEYWVPPLIIIGMLCAWIMHVSRKPDYDIRKVVYLIFGMLAIFFHGVHETSFFDVAVVVLMSMVTYSFFDEIYMMNLILLEYFVVLILQVVLALKSEQIIFDDLNISRIALHLSIVCMVYLNCVKAIRDRAEMTRILKEKDRRIDAVDADMEDFLSNISHELRTPVNVVNGISEMLIKKGLGSEVFSIKNAGRRLAHQIEDIQDYTECKRGNVILEEEEYSSTALINNVVKGFKLLENGKNLELIVDMDPRIPSKLRGDVNKLQKIFRHLVENAYKFTRKGGIYIRMYAEDKDYGINLCIEMTDTGIGMDRRTIASLKEGMYQVNKKRNRSSGGIGLGLYIVYGFAHEMGGFVQIESEKKNGTTVRVTIPQQVLDITPALAISESFSGDILFHVRQDKYKVPRVRDFYRSMAANLASGMRVPLYPAQTLKEVEDLRAKKDVSFIFMGQEEYEENPQYFDELSKEDVVVAVSANPGFKANPGSGVLIMPKPLYGYPVVRVINEGRNVTDLENSEGGERPLFSGVKALIVDDEPMNLVVATGLFREYEMFIETARSGKEAVKKFREGSFDVIFMDHMMPEMDGVQAMKLIKEAAHEMNKNVIIIALTANVVSGAREMFMKEGFDGFIAKPISTADFERLMVRELRRTGLYKGGEAT